MEKDYETVFILLGDFNAYYDYKLKGAKTIDALMRASYEVVSGEKGAKRQWERSFLFNTNGSF